MKRIIMPVAIGLVLGINSWGAWMAQQKEESIKMSEVPKTVQSTFHERAGGAKILRVEKSSENGRIVYKAVVSKDGKETDINVGQDGKFLGTRDEAREYNLKKQ